MAVKTNFSDGDFPLAKIVSKLRPKNIKVIILGDDAQRKWTFGLWPLRGIIKKTYEESSILKIGAAPFLKEVERIQKENPDFVVIPGARVSPFYAWSGDVFKRRLVLSGWNKKLLVLGLTKAQDYEQLPMVSNERFLFARPKDILKLWPMLFSLLGIWLIGRKKVFEFQGLKYTLRSKFLRVLGGIILAVSLVFLINNLSFTFKFNPYTVKKSILPYQEAIDYVNKQGALVFWMNPAAGETTRLGPVTTLTEPDEGVLFLSQGYTGICISSADGIVSAGGAWDKLLKDYCQGKRGTPVWIVGDANLYLAGQHELKFYLDSVFLVSQPTPQTILEALKTGRFYVRFKTDEKEIVLEDFSVSDSGIIRVKGKVSPGLEQENLSIELIKDGNIVFQKSDLSSGGFDLEFPDTEISSAKSFYRLKISSAGVWVLSNPVFVQRNKE